MITFPQDDVFAICWSSSSSCSASPHVQFLHALRFTAPSDTPHASTTDTHTQQPLTHTFIVVLAARGWIKINAILNNTIKKLYNVKILEIIRWDVKYI